MDLWLKRKNHTIIITTTIMLTITIITPTAVLWGA
jgi:hypothetical protein